MPRSGLENDRSRHPQLLTGQFRVMGSPVAVRHLDTPGKQGRHTRTARDARVKFDLVEAALCGGEASTWPKSATIRCRIVCVSGSPSRTLYSRSFGPSAVIIRPAKRKSGEAGLCDGGPDDGVENVDSLCASVRMRLNRSTLPCRRCLALGRRHSDGFVILARFEYSRIVFAVRQNDEAHFFASKELLDH